METQGFPTPKPEPTQVDILSTPTPESPTKIEIVKDRFPSWRFPAFVAVAFISIAAAISAYGMFRQLNAINAQIECRDRHVASHDLIRSRLDEEIISLLVAGSEEDRLMVIDRLNSLGEELERARRIRVEAFESC